MQVQFLVQRMHLMHTTLVVDCACAYGTHMHEFHPFGCPYTLWNTGVGTLQAAAYGAWYLVVCMAVWRQHSCVTMAQHTAFLMFPQAFVVDCHSPGDRTGKTFCRNGTPAIDADPQVLQGTWVQFEFQSVYVGVCHVQLT